MLWFCNVFINFDIWNVLFHWFFLKLTADSRTPTNKCSNIRSLHSEATMSKTRVFMPDSFSLSCKDVRTGSLDWMEQDWNLMKTDKSLKYCVKGLCVKRYYIKEMPRNSKVEIQYREFVLGQVVGFCGFINSALQPEQSLFSLPEYTANYKLPLLNLSELPDLKGLNASWSSYSRQERN